MQLLGTWFMYYSTLFGFIACCVLFVKEMVQADENSSININITLFIYGTTITDYVGFLIGSIYFVAGEPLMHVNY